MVDRIGAGGGLASAAIEAALRRHAEIAARLKDVTPGQLGPPSLGTSALGAPPVEHKPFAGELTSSIKQLDATVRAADRLHLDVVTGSVQDLHEVAAQLKASDLSFKFALATRNKLVEAYREIMRMGV